MISLIQKQNIILMNYREGRSQREINRITGVDRKTIRKYIEKYEEQRKELHQGKQNEIELIRSIVESPTYTTGKRPKRKLTEAMELSIQKHLLLGGFLDKLNIVSTIYNSLINEK